MKTLSLLAVLTSCALLSPLASAAESAGLKGCAAKKHELQAQIDQARANHNTHQEAGLKTALKQVNAHCTDASLRKERESKIKAAQHEVSERQADLEEANKKGDPDKISKRQAKLEESRRELQSAQDELHQ